jgi:hypothetical protein
MGQSGSGTHTFFIIFFPFFVNHKKINDFELKHHVDHQLVDAFPRNYWSIASVRLWLQVAEYQTPVNQVPQH